MEENLKKKSFCWIKNNFYDIENEFMEYFKINNISMKNFRIFYINLFSQNELNFNNFKRISNKYNNLIKNNFEIFQFNVLKPNKSILIQKKFFQDLPRTIKKLRKDIGLNSDEFIDNDPVISWFSEMLLYIDFKGVTYRQGFCDLLIPLFHVFLNGLISIYSFNDDMLKFNEKFYNVINLSCAISAEGFIKLMKKKINHLKMFPDLMGINIASSILTNLLNSLKEFKKLSISDTKLFCSSWILLIFTQSFNLSDIILLWIELFNNINNFHEELIKYCYCSSILILKKSGDNFFQNFIETMQNNSYLNFFEIQKIYLSLNLKIPKIIFEIKS